nr:MAG TPA: hypothetical protein [Bacteriophage sp.]DAV93286.1 MAG TPA: hypothetical protein [Caudoviricetes sp.]
MRRVASGFNIQRFHYTKQSQKDEYKMVIWFYLEKT